MAPYVSFTLSRGWFWHPPTTTSGGHWGGVGEDVGICGGKWLTVGGSGDYGDLRGTAGVSRSGEPQCLLECMSAN